MQSSEFRSERLGCNVEIWIDLEMQFGPVPPFSGACPWSSQVMSASNQKSENEVRRETALLSCYASA